MCLKEMRIYLRNIKINKIACEIRNNALGNLFRIFSFLFSLQEKKWHVPVLFAYVNWFRLCYRILFPLVFLFFFFFISFGHVRVPSTRLFLLPSRSLFVTTNVPNVPQRESVTGKKFAFPATSWFYCCETCVAADFYVVTADWAPLGETEWFVAASKTDVGGRADVFVTSSFCISHVFYLLYSDSFPSW